MDRTPCTLVILNEAFSDLLYSTPKNCFLVQLPKNDNETVLAQSKWNKNNLKHIFLIGVKIRDYEAELRCRLKCWELEIIWVHFVPWLDHKFVSTFDAVDKTLPVHLHTGRRNLDDEKYVFKKLMYLFWSIPVSIRKLLCLKYPVF